MVGKELSHYLISSRLGAGGMGEVYRARDVRLGRDIAVKMLPEAFAQDSERIARFEREAKVLASLNHAGIAALYGFEESDGRHFLVMELVEGETIAERVARGPIPVEDALKIAHQIAEALEFAHDKGIIHRDLKPANVKITPDGKVKVLDFGLAKAFAPASKPQDIMSSPTLSVAATTPGVILGTAPYMSPEQAKGFEADRRSDIFSFGAVLYEMLTGRQSFVGDTITEVIASVLARQPDLNALPANINPRIEELIRRCLEKDIKRRRQTIADVRVEIDAILADPQGLKLRPHAVEQRPLWKRAIPLVATAALVAGLTAGIMWNRRPAENVKVARFSFAIPEAQRLTRTGRHMISFSPDGSNIVYVANNQLFLRTISELEARPIQGTDLDVDTPFFSPDSRWIAFHSNTEGKFKKIAVTGGASVTICDAQLPFGASWTDDGHILIGAGSAGILRVSANGGKPETVVTVKADEQAHGPQLLPDGDSILFTLVKGSTGVERWDKGQIVIHSLKSGRRKVLMEESGSDARYVPTGHIVYALAATLLAVPFDLKDLKITGGPVPVLEGVRRAGVGTGAANFSTSADGSLAYIPGGVPNVAGARTLALVDRNGVRKSLPVPPANYFSPRISPNGKQLAVSTDDGKEAAVSVYDLSGSTSMRRLTFGGANRFPIWTYDGQRIIFQSDREKDLGLFWQRADGNGTAERLTRPEGQTSHIPDSFPDGKTLIFSVLGADGSIWKTSPDRESKAKVLIDAPSTNQFSSSVSPDGHWIAYISAESGQANIYVQPLPPTGAKFQITTGGGLFPMWSPDGKQIFYVINRGPFGDMWSLDVQTKPTFTFGKPTSLPIKSFPMNGGQGNPRGFDIAPDGKQFVIMQVAGEAAAEPSQQILVTLHWFEELKQRTGMK
jgi:serine/threonine-protein kinase